MANKYYDPKKAHEYYLKHRQLKGKSSSKKKSSKKKSTTSTTGLNEAGKREAKVAQAKLNLQKKALMKQKSAELKAQLADIKARFNSMSPEEQQKLGSSLEDALLNIQAEFEVKKKEISDQYKAQYISQLADLKTKDEFKE